MYRLQKTFTFEASHQLPHHDGKCKRLHGHSWKGTVIVDGESLFIDGPKQGMLLDFGSIGAIVERLREHCLDHYHLNESTGLESPTSELLAKWIYDQLLEQIPGLVCVRVEETCTCSASYWRHREGSF